MAKHEACPSCTCRPTIGLGSVISLIDEADKSLYLVAQVAVHQCILICVTGGLPGNRFDDKAVTVKNSSALSPEEINQLTCGSGWVLFQEKLRVQL